MVFMGIIAVDGFGVDLSGAAEGFEADLRGVAECFGARNDPGSRGRPHTDSGIHRADEDIA